MNIAEQLLEIGGFGLAHRREIEMELAYAQRASVHNHRGAIRWALHFPWLKRRLCDRQDHRCCWCGKPMAAAAPRDDRPTFDHVVPLSRGGADEPANLVIACHACNNRRGDADVPP